MLNDIHIDIMDYIIPAQCSDQEFLQMWVLFEWENKVVVNTNLKAESIYEGPTTANKPQDLVRPIWSADPCAKTVATHLLIIDSKAEHDQLLASKPFMDTIAKNLQNIGAYLGAGARFRNDLPLTEPGTWRNGEGGQFPGTWGTNDPASGGGRCVVMVPSGKFANVKCFLPADISATRDVLCEREQACAIPAGGTAHVGYLGPDNHCYARFSTPEDKPVSRAEAEATCAEGGAHLVAFETIAELQNLTGADLTSGGVWTAARKLACADDKLRWETDGKDINGDAAFWSENEPKLTSGSCVIVGRDRRLAVTACEGTAGVLCEREY